MTTTDASAHIPDLRVEIAPRGKHGLVLRNPVMTASGTFGNAIEFARLVDVSRLGAIVSKGVTLRPRTGNPAPRTVETPAGMLNSIGLQNIGIDALIRDVAPVWATWDVPAIINIAAERIGDYAEIAARLDGVPGVAAIELNISCPNVESGLEFGRDPRAAADVTAAVRRRCGLPLIVKLTPNTAAELDIARAVVEAGADALCVANTLLGMAIDVGARAPVLARGAGGLSGPAVRPLILRMVWDIAGAVDVPIVASGGVTLGDDAAQYLLAGASAVQVGTASFRDPGAASRVLDELTAILRAQGVRELREIVGAARDKLAKAHDGV